MIVIDGMGGLVGWAKVNGQKVAVYSAERASNDLQDREGLTWREAEEVIDAAQQGLQEAVDAGDLRASPVIVWAADEDDLRRMAREEDDD
jgi:hypothetical protein